MKAYSSAASRHLLVRAVAGELLPDALVSALAEQAVTGGWLRGSGVLDDVELRAYRTEAGGLGASRRLTGPAQAVVLEGSVGTTRGELTVGMRVVLTRETELGLETIAGELVGAKVLAFEAHVVAFDDLAVTRAHDTHGGIWLAEEAHAIAHFGSGPAAAPVPAEHPSTAGVTTWAEAAVMAVAPAATPLAAPGLVLSALRKPAVTAASSQGGGAPIPARLPRPSKVEDDGELPEAGDLVEHFTFGRCEVFKSDGDRLHIRVQKDGRVREIALEMLRVAPMPAEGDRRRFRLERRTS